MPIPFRLKEEAENQMKGYLNSVNEHYAGAPYDSGPLRSHIYVVWRKNV
jgi:hypothetical protein